MEKGMKELRDLYDENKKVTGEKIYKGENIPPNRYILVVTLFIKTFISLKIDRYLTFS